MRSAVRFLAIAAGLAVVASACTSKSDEARRPSAPVVAAHEAAADAGDAEMERAPRTEPQAPPATPPATPPAATPAPATPPAATPTPPPAPATAAAGEATRNLQVLPRTWTRERVELYMKQRVARGLGVKCAYCHDARDFAADGERKQAARAMIRVTNDINRDYFDGHQRVSCATCHHGQPKPGP